MTNDKSDLSALSAAGLLHLAQEGAHALSGLSAPPPFSLGAMYAPAHPGHPLSHRHASPPSFQARAPSPFGYHGSRASIIPVPGRRSRVFERKKYGAVEGPPWLPRALFSKHEWLLLAALSIAWGIKTPSRPPASASQDGMVSRLLCTTQLCRRTKRKLPTGLTM